MNAGEVLKFGLVLAIVWMVYRWMIAGGLRASASVTPYNGAPQYDYGVSPWDNTTNGYGYDGGFGPLGPSGFSVGLPIGVISGTFSQMQRAPGIHY